MIAAATVARHGASLWRAAVLWVARLSMGAVLISGMATTHAASASPAVSLPPVVVWDFDNQTVPALASIPVGAADWLQRSLSESLVAALLRQPGQVVVDRLKLRAVLAEQQLGAGELTDQATRLRLGRIAGAQRMVFGGFFVVGDQVQVNVRVVDAATSRVLFSDEATSPFDAVMQHQPALATRVVQAMGGAAGAEPGPAHADEVWQAHDRALALADAGRLDEALQALQALLTVHPGFAPAERLVPVLLDTMARR
jgi:curli biogenesis system outer membrane secretion channel CsgG